MVERGSEKRLAFHQAINSSKGTKDCARQAIESGIPTYLIASEAAAPKRLSVSDPRLK